MRVAIYTRVSTDEQATDDKLSMRDQEEKCRAWCVANGHLIVGVFSDPGVSGGTLDRPGLQAALTAARAREYDMLLAKCMDRLTRDTDHGGHLATILRANNVTLQLVDEDFEQTAIGKLMRTISTWRGEEEREKLRSRAIVGRKGRAIAGKTNAPTQAFGYRREIIATKTDPKTGRERPVYADAISIDEYEAAIVRRVYTMYLEGTSIRQIAARLNAEGVRMKRHGKGWLPESVRRLLEAERYTGHGWQNRQIVKNGVSTLRGEAEWQPIEYPVIIERTTWDAVQERLAQNKPWRRGPAGVMHHLLQGMLYCLTCGYPMSASNVGHGRQRSIYRCVGHAKRGSDFCPVGHVAAGKIDGPVWDRLVDACHNPELWMTNKAVHDAQEADRETDARQLLDGIRAQREKAVTERGRLVQAVAIGTFRSDQPDVVRLMADYDNRIDAWDHEVVRIEARTTQYEHDALTRAEAEALALALAEQIDQLQPEERRAFVRLLVTRVWYDREGNITVEASLPAFEKMGAGKSHLAA